ncbi:hypothetical protein AOQ84DRAFT_415049 [Glonium stellatum]|uniref:Protein kinase domain-containing protein n=1 Tax=Glonium stellatum TaxID=574774 RepID=A0A8E2JXP3_9PEZI|nr:hypothetical protein AOQ84DRAFT_415049 [Glonium stellatum]
MFDAVLNPTAIYGSPLLERDEDTLASSNWESSYLNPKNRVESLSPPNHPKWRLDGVDVDGTRFFAVPTFALGHPPLRIDVYIPSQDQYPASLRQILQQSSTLLLGSKQATRLGISQHVLRALEFWSGQLPNFQSLYNEMPFGCRIDIYTICSDIRKMNICFFPTYEVEQQLCSVKTLQEMWNIPPANWPEAVNLTELQMQFQLHEAITLVRIPTRHPLETFVFKSLVRDVKYLYHELKIFISTEPHPNIIPRPLYVVTKNCRFGGKVGICGFILPYYPLGTLRDKLFQSRSGIIPSISLQDQFRWARHITQALIHVNNSAPGFYPDLKPDNVLLNARNGILDVMLIDLEQRGGWFSWSPPEVAYIEYQEYIATRVECEPVKNKCKALLCALIPGWQPLTQDDRYRNSEQGFSSAWLSLTQTEREAAQVFMLGKLFWCIFESMASINCGIGIEIFREQDWEHRFPEFRATPMELRELIRSCTAGAPEWKGKHRNIVRHGTNFFSVERLGKEFPEGSAAETKEAARRWWREEVRSAKRFLENRAKNKETIQRPRLVEVLEAVEKVKITLLPG